MIGSSITKVPVDRHEWLVWVAVPAWFLNAVGLLIEAPALGVPFLLTIGAFVVLNVACNWRNPRFWLGAVGFVVGAFFVAALLVRLTS